MPFSAGGAADMVARILAQQLQGALGQSVIVENKVGAGGSIATNLVAKSPPDGRTILVATVTQLAIAPLLYKELLQYDPQKDFASIILAANYSMAVVVPQSSPFRTIKELLDHLKVDSNASYASAGIGSIQHLGGEMLRKMAGIKAQHIPYKGGAPALVALVGGEVTFTMGVLADCVPLVNEGRLRALAVTAPDRIAAFPNLPALAEFVPGFDLGGWYAFVVPAATPTETVIRLNAAFDGVLKDPKISSRLTDSWLDVVGGPPSHLTETMANDIAKFRKIIADSNIKVD